MKEKKVPMRTCLGCMNEQPKKDLLRIVRMTDGSICLDGSGKLNGRGAYVCRNIKCMDVICRAHKLGKAFGEQPDQEVYNRIRNDMEKFLTSDGGGIDGRK